jgi:hypothetical protein
VGAFYLVGAEVTGAAVITILGGPAVDTTVILSKYYDSYKRSGEHLFRSAQCQTILSVIII